MGILEQASAYIRGWVFASDDWSAPAAEDDLRMAGMFRTVIAANDKNMSFDFIGTYTAAIENELIEYYMDDGGPHVKVGFVDSPPKSVRVTKTLDPRAKTLWRQSAQAGRQFWITSRNTSKAVPNNQEKALRLNL